MSKSYVSSGNKEDTSHRDDQKSKESLTGTSYNRVEDHRILTGESEYIHDITPDDCLHLAIVRSPHPHAKIKSIDTNEAKSHPDCALILTANDIKSQYNPMPTGLGKIYTDTESDNDEPIELPEWALANGRTRFVGEPVVAVVATDRYSAEDIVDLVEVEYKPLKPVTDAIDARKDEVIIHQGVGTNVADTESFEFGNPKSAFKDADYVIEGEYSWGRISGVPLETAGVVAEYDRDTDSFSIDCNIQLHTLVDDTIYRTLGYDPKDVRVNVPSDIGGSFGTKIAIHRYCCLAAMASQQINRPVKFEEDRIENLIGGDMHCSDREYKMRMAVDEDGTMRGLDIWFIDDFGAFPRYPVNQVVKPLSVLTNSYMIEDVSYEYELVLTNKTSQTAYRGFGVPPHIYAIEMIIDEAARELNIDPTEFRRQNLIQPEQMPYRLPSKNIYDSGDYPQILHRVNELIDTEREEGGLLDPQIVKEKRTEGKYRGVQPGVIIEPGVSGSDWTDRQRSDRSQLSDRDRSDVEELPEYLQVRIDEDGSVTVLLAADSSGQGHQTIVSQLLADELEISPEKINVGYLDSVDAPTVYGSAASRMAVMLSGAATGIGEKLTNNLQLLASEHWDCQFGEVHYRNGSVERIGSENKISIGELAKIDADRAPDKRLIDVSYKYDHPATNIEAFDEAFAEKLPVYPTASFGANAPIVEVDIHTGDVEILAFYTVRDCGTMLNPMIVDGQAHGGIAQGIGAALLEEFAYDESGQPQATMLDEYLLPSVMNVPPIIMEHTITPSPFTETGAKGVGEGGMIDAPASIASSINDALEPLGIVADRIPVTPNRLRQKLRDCE